MLYTLNLYNICQLYLILKKKFCYAMFLYCFLLLDDIFKLVCSILIKFSILKNNFLGDVNICNLMGVFLLCFSLMAPNLLESLRTFIHLLW